MFANTSVRYLSIFYLLLLYHNIYALSNYLTAIYSVFLVSVLPFFFNLFASSSKYSYFVRLSWFVNDNVIVIFFMSVKTLFFKIFQTTVALLEEKIFKFSLRFFRGLGKTFHQQAVRVAGHFWKVDIHFPCLQS